MHVLPHTPPEKLIILDGGSSAGKTSVAREFQELAPEGWMHPGNGAFWCALPLASSTCSDLNEIFTGYEVWTVGPLPAPPSSRPAATSRP